MLGRLLIGTGLFALGYYLGRESQRFAPVREELRRARARRAADSAAAPGAPARDATAEGAPAAPEPD